MQRIAFPTDKPTTFKTGTLMGNVDGLVRTIVQKFGGISFTDTVKLIRKGKERGVIVSDKDSRMIAEQYVRELRKAGLLPQKATSKKAKPEPEEAFVSDND